MLTQEVAFLPLMFRSVCDRWIKALNCMYELSHTLSISVHSNLHMHLTKYK